jgi:hypothetical protein
MLTKYQKVLKAIQLAKKPGKCQYIDNDKPCCVVAQLASLEGYSVSHLKTWDYPVKVGEGANSSSIHAVFSDGKGKTLRKKYDSKLLQELQRLWDGGEHKDIKILKKDMVKLTNEHFEIQKDK